jgi:hypothetical protein
LKSSSKPNGKGNVAQLNPFSLCGAKTPSAAKLMLGSDFIGAEPGKPTGLSSIADFLPTSVRRREDAGRVCCPQFQIMLLGGLGSLCFFLKILETLL